MIMDTCKLTLQKELEKLSAEARELYIPSEVPRIEYAPNALQFYREFVAANNPVIIRNSINHWSCFRKWTNEYLRSKVGEKSVTVAVTPNGYADAPLQDRFVLPEERTLKFKEFLDIMKSNEGKTEPDELGIFYIQKQNSNLTEEFSELISDTGEYVCITLNTKRHLNLNFEVISIFLLTDLSIYTGEYTKPKAQCYAGPKGRHYEGHRLWIRLYRYASQLVRSLLPD